MCVCMLCVHAYVMCVYACARVVCVCVRVCVHMGLCMYALYLVSSLTYNNILYKCIHTYMHIHAHMHTHTHAAHTNLVAYYFHL